MNFLSQTLSKNCSKHNQRILYYDQELRSLLCETCILENGRLIPFENIEKQYQEQIISTSQEYDLQISQLNKLKDKLLNFKEQVFLSLNKIIEQITNQIMNIESQKQQLQELEILISQYDTIDQLKNQLNDIQQNNQKIIVRINNQLNDFKQQFNIIDNLLTISNNALINYDQNSNMDLMVNKSEERKSQNYQFELIQNKTNNDVIKDFAFDEKNNTLIAAMNSGAISVYEFKNGKIGNELQSLKYHDRAVVCLCLMKNKQCLASGGFDQQIIIWGLDINKQWIIQQVLSGHKNYIECIISNPQEDLFISGSLDQAIKFWRWHNNNNCWVLSQTIETSYYIHALSLNDNGNKLISCGSEISVQQITVLNCQSNQKWIIAQRIELNESGYRLCFTIGDQFVFQSETQDHLSVYEYDNDKQQYLVKYKVKVQSCKYCNNKFPCQYLNTLNILIAKHGQFVNILKVKQNGNCELIQSIKFKSYNTYGRITSDGKYLIIYDQEIKEISVRNLKHVDIK